MRANHSWPGLRAYATNKWYYFMASMVVLFYALVEIITAKAAYAVECDPTVSNAIKPAADFAGGTAASLADRYGGYVLIGLGVALVFAGGTKKSGWIIKSLAVTFIAMLLVFVLVKRGDNITPSIC